ncbi:MAG: GTPase Era, partial [Syntrophales bacterium]
MVSFKSGFIGIIGRPNVGKSTLLNTILGEKIAIVTDKPQTTRNRIMGIKNLPGGQLIFLDTPGIHSPHTPLNRSMVAAAMDTISQVDLILFLVDAVSGMVDGDKAILDKMKGSPVPRILIINKIDLVKSPVILSVIDFCRQFYPFQEIIPVSAKSTAGVNIVTDEILKLLPEGPACFPEDILTDRSERFIAAEIIREKITLLTQKEIPYATAVVVETFKDADPKGKMHIQATIHVEKDSQKGIIIGSRGAMLKKIG